MASMNRSPVYDDHSSGSERKQSTPGAKKRPSRAGTRSVTTLTAAQLERKRANDREAQRAIRQRTKDHIESLERQVRDLTAQIGTNSSTKMMELMRRNEELEQENALLRARLSHAGQALGMLEGAGAPSPSDRIQILSHARRSSTGTARSVHSVPEITTTPVAQPAPWQQQQQHPQPPQHQQHAYSPNVPSPHVEHPPTNWSSHPSAHPSQHPVSLSVPDSSLHAVESGNMPYPTPYSMDHNTRAMSYPLENASLVTSQAMQIGGYNTPTSNPSAHSSDYHRQMSVPMNNASPAGHGQHPHSYSSPAHHGYVPQSSHPGEMHMMAPASHQQSHMVNEQGQMMYHLPPHMKVEH
ncbi:uncharacterized protein CC84DRAFT_1090895 [Paraphaeosphaeria sporulosa]|uniref:BZIP domain-containing protein n=1 Tax=Paraphaeosphaeria sporulosa TaxID=1460663 RepID=A0A177CGG8_9PLEO|nr:uncharacterized protein CC84DRAFT_1090895 [Paraphaeosphaeria sporulosa]OAG05850.1 hypothetical protein CC84DRAFT_1090895 [Paraphaeosphaeria sporulosa]